MIILQYLKIRDFLQLYYFKYGTTSGTLPISGILSTCTVGENSSTLKNFYENFNNKYNSKFYAYNFNQNTVQRGAPYCDSISADIFPYQFEKFNVKQSTNSNRFGPNYRSNANINKISQIVSSNLVPYEYSTYTNDIIGSDSNLVGYYISPYRYLNENIEDFLGKEGISDIIGDPKYLTSRNYPELFFSRRVS